MDKEDKIIVIGSILLVLLGIVIIIASLPITIEITDKDWGKCKSRPIYMIDICEQKN